MVSLRDVFLKKMPKLLTYVYFYDILIIPLRILFFSHRGRYENRAEITLNNTGMSGTISAAYFPYF